MALEQAIADVVWIESWLLDWMEFVLEFLFVDLMWTKSLVLVQEDALAVLQICLQAVLDLVKLSES